MTTVNGNTVTQPAPISGFEQQRSIFNTYWSSVTRPTADQPTGAKMESEMTANKFWVFPYAQGSEGAKLLCDELGCKRILREGSTFSKKATDVVINWGASDCPASYDALNKDIKGILNKAEFFKRLAGTGLTPAFAFNKMDAADNLGFPIFCRTKLEGKDGEGIVIAEKFSQIVAAKLYTQYEDKTSEYRIHVGRGPSGYTVIGAQKKVKKAQADGPNVSPDSRIMTGDDHGLIWKARRASQFTSRLRCRTASRRRSRSSPNSPSAPSTSSTTTPPARRMSLKRIPRRWELRRR
jgi:hypothetical protein